MLLIRLILLFCLQQIPKIRAASRTMEFIDARLTFSPKYYSNYTIFIRNGSVFMDMNIIQPLVPGFKIFSDFQVRLRNSKSYLSIFSHSFDACAMLTTFKNPLAKKWFESTKKYGNLMLNCPLATGHYYINGWRPSSNLVPSYFMEGDYRIATHFFLGKYKTASEIFILHCELDAVIK